MYFGLPNPQDPSAKPKCFFVSQIFLQTQHLEPKLKVLRKEEIEFETQNLRKHIEEINARLTTEEKNEIIQGKSKFQFKISTLDSVQPNPFSNGIFTISIFEKAVFIVSNNPNKKYSHGRLLKEVKWVLSSWCFDI